MIARLQSKTKTSICFFFFFFLLLQVVLVHLWFPSWRDARMACVGIRPPTPRARRGDQECEDQQQLCHVNKLRLWDRSCLADWPCSSARRGGIPSRAPLSSSGRPLRLSSAVRDENTRWYSHLRQGVERSGDVGFSRALDSLLP